MQCIMRRVLVVKKTNSKREGHMIVRG